MFELGLISTGLWFGIPGLWTLLPRDQRTESRKEDPGESRAWGSLSEVFPGLSALLECVLPSSQVLPLSRRFFRA